MCIHEHTRLMLQNYIQVKSEFSFGLVIMRLFYIFACGLVIQWFSNDNFGKVLARRLVVGTKIRVLFIHSLADWY